MEWMDTETVKKVFEVNAIGPVTVTNAFLPLLRISHGRVVVVSSLAGMHTQSSHCIFWIECFTSNTSQNFWNQDALHSISSQKRCRKFIFYEQTERKPFCNVKLFTLNTKTSTNWISWMFLSIFVVTNVVIWDNVKSVGGVQRPTVTSTFKIREYFSMKRVRAAFFVWLCSLVHSLTFFF